MTIILQLIYNMGALLAVSIISGLINYKHHKKWMKWLVQGSIYGTACIIGMLKPLVLVPGMIFDGRSVMLSLCGMFFGPKAVAVAAVMAITLRVYQGGPGMIMGVCVIITSSLLGVYFYNNQKTHNQTITGKKLYFMGILVHIIMVLLMITLPKEKVISTMKSLSIPIILVYPLITVFIGKVLSFSNESRIILNKLQKNENRLKTIFDQAPVGITLSNTNTGIITYANPKFIKIIGYSLEEIVGVDWMSITYPEDLPNEKNEKENSKLKTVEYEKRYIKKDGSIIWTNLKIVLNIESDDDYDEICFIEDITHKKKSKDALALSERNFRMLFENSTDAILTFYDNKILDCNKSAAIMFANGKKETLIRKGIIDISPKKQPDGQLSEVKAANMMALCKENSYHKFEWTNELENGNRIITEIVLTPIILEGIEVLHALIRDISERKKMEMQMEYLSYHDELTGLYNRRFFHEELKRLDVSQNLPLTLMMGDVNGLKLINDSFGHASGDELLKKVANLIQENCRSEEIIARIGGDEFIVIIPRANEIEVAAISKRVQEAASKDKMNNLDISISFGWASKVSPEEDINEVLRKAEDSLYKKKLFESPSMRSKNIHTIMHTLHEKNEREEKHSKRVSDLCEKMGKALKMHEDEIKELKSVGLLHDIGKIGIDESMLNKNGKLTKDEWTEMTKHSEVGYRILSTVNEMSEMAEYVLAHHERWDGNGYPKGLKADEIPFKARIIALADSFDAMTSDRSYRKAISVEKALDEIIDNAGTQFDPELSTIFKQMMEDSSF